MREAWARREPLPARLGPVDCLPHSFRPTAYLYNLLRYITTIGAGHYRNWTATCLQAPRNCGLMTFEAFVFRADTDRNRFVAIVLIVTQLSIRDGKSLNPRGNRRSKAFAW